MIAYIKGSLEVKSNNYVVQFKLKQYYMLALNFAQIGEKHLMRTPRVRISEMNSMPVET